MIDPLCPECSQLVDAATALDGGRGPKVNDFSLCLYCGALLVFACVDPHVFRVPTPEERQEFRLHSKRVAAETVVRLYATEEPRDA